MRRVVCKSPKGAKKVRTMFELESPNELVRFFASVIQYVVNEAITFGITDILMIIGKGKRTIEEHFDRNFQLEAQLVGQGEELELKTIRKISELANLHFVWQWSYGTEAQYAYSGTSKVGSSQYELKRRWSAQPIRLRYQYWTRFAQEFSSVKPENPKYKNKIQMWKKLLLWMTRLVGPHFSRSLPQIDDYAQQIP